MAFIDKKDPVVLNIKLTSEGRKQLAAGNLKFKYFAVGDSEIDYNFNYETGHISAESNILRPLDNNPNILSFITKEVSGDPYNAIPSVGSQYLVVNSTEPNGFFTNINDSTFTFIDDGNHVKQPNAMVDMSNLLLSTANNKQLPLKKIPSISWNGIEPAVKDLVLVKWTLNGDTTNYVTDKTKPTPFLMYRITGITSGTLGGDNLIVGVDRNLPNFSTYLPIGKAGAMIYYSGETMYSGDTLFTYSPDYLDESVLAFLQNSKCPTVIFPFWNMSIIFTEEIAGVQVGRKTYGQFSSHEYAGFVSYIQNQAPYYKKLGVIHYTNSSPANVYAEGFYLNTAKLIVPTIMWHKSSGTTLGATFVAGNGYILNGLNAHYYDLVDASDPTVIVGKIFDELKLFVIEDPELLFAMSYKSNRSWTLPQPIAAAGGGNCAEPAPIYELFTIEGTPGSIQNTGAYGITMADEVTEYGMQFRKSTEPADVWHTTIRGAKLPKIGDITQDYFNTSMDNLDANTEYQYRAYAVWNGANLYTGDILTIRTPIAPPEVTLAIVVTNIPSPIAQTTATGQGVVSSDGGAAITERGFVWGESPNPTIAGNKVAVAGTTGAFSGAMTGLVPNTSYRVRAYAINSVGVAYGANVEFDTLAVTAVAPTVTTTPVIAIVPTGAKSGGNVTSDGGASVTARGVVIGTSSNPTILSYFVKIDNGSGTGAFLSLIGGLNGSTTYHIRAFATNSVGTSYGDDISFTTTAAAAVPVVTTIGPDIIGTTTATVDGDVTSDSGSAITERGIVYSIFTGPTVADNKAIYNPPATGYYTANLIGLAAHTTYNIRAYACNSIGVGYGLQQSFSTIAGAGIPVYMDYTLDTCRAVLETTPSIMPESSCFSLSVNYDIYKGPMKASAFACVVCNGVRKYYNSSVGTNEFATYAASGLWGPFEVKDTDTVCFCATAIDVLGGNPTANISFATISNIVGNFTASTPYMVWDGSPPL